MVHTYTRQNEQHRELSKLTVWLQIFVVNILLLQWLSNYIVYWSADFTRVVPPAQEQNCVEQCSHLALHSGFLFILRLIAQMNSTVYFDIH